MLCFILHLHTHSLSLTQFPIRSYVCTILRSRWIVVMWPLSRSLSHSFVTPLCLDFINCNNSTRPRFFRCESSLPRWPIARGRKQASMDRHWRFSQGNPPVGSVQRPPVFLGCGAHGTENVECHPTSSTSLRRVWCSRPEETKSATNYPNLFPKKCVRSRAIVCPSLWQGVLKAISAFRDFHPPPCYLYGPFIFGDAALLCSSARRIYYLLYGWAKRDYWGQQKKASWELGSSAIPSLLKTQYT